jgi:hypothetical protein
MRASGLPAYSRLSSLSVVFIELGLPALYSDLARLLCSQPTCSPTITNTHRPYVAVHMSLPFMPQFVARSTSIVCEIHEDGDADGTSAAASRITKTAKMCRHPSRFGNG